MIVAGRAIRLADPLTWCQWLWTAIPLVLVFIGGGLTGDLGGAAMAINIRILRSGKAAVLRYALATLLSPGAPVLTASLQGCSFLLLTQNSLLVLPVGHLKVAATRTSMCDRPPFPADSSLLPRDQR